MNVQTDGIAELSYLVGDDAAGVAAVFDPRPDVDCYLDLASAKQVSITHIFETHIHADLVSGARELGARVASARIFVSHEPLPKVRPKARAALRSGHGQVSVMRLESHGMAQKRLSEIILN